MSQPRNFLGGQLLSALVGITTRVVISTVWIAGPVGMSLALVLMQCTSTTHPPGKPGAHGAALSDTDRSPYSSLQPAAVACQPAIGGVFGWHSPAGLPHRAACSHSRRRRHRPHRLHAAHAAQVARLLLPRDCRGGQRGDAMHRAGCQQLGPPPPLPHLLVVTCWLGLEFRPVLAPRCRTPHRQPCRQSGHALNSSCCIPPFLSLARPPCC